MSYWSRSFLGHAECLAEVRRFTAAVLGDRPGADIVVLAASELAANAILHTASGAPDGQFVLHLATFADRWQVRVDDAGGPNVPRLCTGDRTDAEAGRGLAMIEALSRCWGVLGDQYARAVWAEIPFPPAEGTGDRGAVGNGGADGGSLGGRNGQTDRNGQSGRSARSERNARESVVRECVRGPDAGGGCAAAGGPDGHEDSEAGFESVDGVDGKEYSHD